MNDADSLPFRRILFIVIALILYGSLYPWDFHARHLAASPLWVLLHSWPARLDRYIVWDVVVNVTLYLPLGIFAFLAQRTTASRFRRIALPLALGVALSASIEMVQLFDDARVCSLSDVLSNGLGTAAGVALAGLYRRKLQQVLSGYPAASLLRPSAPVLLLCCWLGYQVFPLFPVWSRTQLRLRLAALHAFSFHPAATFLVFAEWLAVAVLLETIFEKKSELWLLLLLPVVPARLALAGRVLGWSDILGAAAACLVWIALPRRPVRRATPLLLAAALVGGELAPFHFASAQAFNWVPFRGFFNSTWQDGFVVLFRKSFWYGSVIWLWRAAGFRLLPVTVVTAAALMLLEWVQVYLPGRLPDVTDALLAVLMGVLLWLLADTR